MESADLVTRKSTVAVTALRLELFHSHEADLGILCAHSDYVSTHCGGYALIPTLLNGRSRDRFLSVTAAIIKPSGNTGWFCITNQTVCAIIAALVFG